MQTVTLNLYTIDELNDKAKERAREWHRSGIEYPWWDEVQDSLKTFCDGFGVKVLDYSFGGRDAHISTDADNSHFRGFKLKDFDREAMPTGFCFDCALRHTFADQFKQHGDALRAFKSALNQLILDIETDIDYQYSDEAIDESIKANGYEFTEDGHFYR